MQFWAWFWIGVVALTFLIYTGLTVVVTIGGFKDVLAMFANLDRQHGEDGETDERV